MEYSKKAKSIMRTTRSSKEYVKAWDSHIDTLSGLRWTPSENLSDEVKSEMDKLKELVRKIAKDKGLR